MKEKINLSAVNWLSQVTGSRKIFMFYLVVLQAALGGSGVVYALVLRNIVDGAVKADRKNFISGIILVAVLIVFQIICRAMIRRFEEKSRSTYENQLKERLFSILLEKDFASVDSVHSGEWINRLTNDTVVCANGITEIIPGLTGMVVKLAGAVFMIVMLVPESAFLLVPGFVIMFLVTFLFRKKLKIFHRDIQEKDGTLRMFFQDAIGSLLAVKSFSAEEYCKNKAEVFMSEHQKARMKRNSFSNICNIGFSAAMNGMYLLGIGYGGYGIMNGSLSYGTLTAVLQLISQIQTPFAGISGYIPKFFSVTSSAERLMEAEKFEEQYSGEIMNAEQIKKFYSESFREIRFENVSYSYCKSESGIENIKSENAYVIRDIDFTSRKGEYTALIGHSGCGKSTLLKLFMCLYRPSLGRITLCSDREETLTPKWQKLFAYVPQGNYIMSGTVKDAVSFSGNSDAPDMEKINTALKTACADEFVSELEYGIDTKLGERGQGLSEGQLQRLAIARAVYSDAPFLIFDEATSALDEESERKVLQNLRNMTDKTVIIVTHRAAVLDICDRVYEFTESGEFINDNDNKFRTQLKCGLNK